MYRIKYDAMALRAVGRWFSIATHMMRYVGGLLLLALPLAAGCQGEARASVEERPAAVDVDTVRVEERAVPKTVRLTGSLRGAQESKLSPNASGRIIDVNVDVGSRVKKGDILMKLDTRAAALTVSEMSSQAELARTRRENAKRECERASKLVDAGAISRSEYEKQADQCKTTDIEVRAAEARASQAAQTLGDGTVRAPFDGVVAERLVEPGEYVRADTAILRVAKVETLRLAIEVPEAFVAAAEPGKTVTFGVAAFPGRTWTTTIDRKGVAVRASSRDVVVEALVDNKDGALLSGMFATVDLAVSESNAAVIPKSSVFEVGGKAYVFVDAEGVAEQRVLQLGPAVGDHYSVKRGVKPGESVVTTRPANLENGAAVN